MQGVQERYQSEGGMSRNKAVAMIVEERSNKGRLCGVRDFEGSGEYDNIGFNLYGIWNLAAGVNFKILKVRRTVNV